MSTTTKISLDEYNVMVESGAFDGELRRRIELIQGELREMSPIGARHEESVDRLMKWSVKIHDLDTVRIRVQSSVGLPKLESVPEPDIAWVVERNYSERRPSAEDVYLIVEVSDSSLRYDRGEKADLYAAAGVKDYWVVNLVENVVEVRRDPTTNGYQSLQTYKTGQSIAPLAFPNVSLSISSVIAQETKEN